MEPLYTLLLCLPAALVVITCGCSLAVLGPPAAQPAVSKTGGRGLVGAAQYEEFAGTQ